MSEPFSNKLTPAEAERLAFLAEECGECVQAIGKILRHGYESRNPTDDPHNSSSNRQTLEKEMGDVRAAMIMLCNAGDISRQLVHYNAEQKLANVRMWMHHQAPLLTKEQRLANAKTHTTRPSDSSIYDEICTLCGARDFTMGPDEISERPCSLNTQHHSV